MRIQTFLLCVALVIWRFIIHFNLILRNQGSQMKARCVVGSEWSSSTGFGIAYVVNEGFLLLLKTVFLISKNSGLFLSWKIWKFVGLVNWLRFTHAIEIFLRKYCFCRVIYRFFGCDLCSYFRTENFLRLISSYALIVQFVVWTLELPSVRWNDAWILVSLAGD